VDANIWVDSCGCNELDGLFGSDRDVGEVIRVILFSVLFFVAFLREFLNFISKPTLMRIKILFFAFILTAINSHSQTNLFQKKFIKIDQYVDSFLKEWNVPGLAIGIVYKDQLIYGKGYGFRDVEKKLRVDTKTIFPIASNTKLFTATAAAMLHEEKKLSLDEPVRTYMPTLNFNNDELNAKVTLRDMLSHRTGLPRYDGIWVASPSTRNEMMSTISSMKPQLGFREGYIYNNMMFAASGAVMEAVTGMSWEAIIRTKIFQPLQMKSSFFTDEDMMKANNYSLAYFEPDSTKRLLHYQYIAQSLGLGPAGTMKSNVEDMSHWMIAQLNKGKYTGSQAISENAIKETLIPNAIADRVGKWDELSNSLYGLGRAMQTYKGYKIATHTGSIDGFYSNLTFIPQQELGIFMVYNGSAAGIMRSVLAFPVIDQLLNLSYTPWSERYKKEYLESKIQEKKARDSVNATQVKNTVPSHSLNAYAGKYINSMYGALSVEMENGQLKLLFRNQRSSLHHFHYDQFITKEENNDKPNFRLNFLTNNKGDIDKMTTNPFGDSVAEFVKKK
jgi:CubicO group peptidase (beta-lactamase class C family)